MEDKKLQDILQYFLDILKKAYGNGNTIELQDTFNLLKKKYAAPKKMDTSDDFRGELGDRLKEKHQKEIEIDRKIENLVYEAYKLFNKEQETKKLNFYVETLRSAKQEGGEELLENRFKDLLKSYAPRETFVTSSLGGIINKSEFEFEKDKTRELINKAYTMIKSEAEQELLKLKVKKDNS